MCADPPAVSCEAESVAGGGGRPVLLGCRVHGEPPPAVTWLRSAAHWSDIDLMSRGCRNGRLLDTDGKKYKMEWRLDRRLHTLVIRR